MPAGWRSSGAAGRELEPAFAVAHRQRYGYCPPDGTPIEVVSFRVTAKVPSRPIERMRLQLADCVSTPRPCYFGKEIGNPRTDVRTTRACLRDEPRTGPLLISEPDATTLVPPGARARLDDWDNLVITLR